MARVWRRVVSVPVLAVLLLISFVYYSTFFFPNSNPNPFIFSFLALMSLLSFLVSVLVDPGRVSTDLENPDLTKPDMQTKYCDRCCIHKPSRTHHCRVCKRCVLKMDHHCLWINNCVGYRNYKPFFIFLVYSTIALVYATVIFLYNVFHTDGHFGPYLRIFYVISGTVDISMSLILGTLLGWHVYLLSRNLTTIEHRGEVRAIWLAKKSGHVYRHPFNLGFRNNVTSVLGPNVLTWFSPVALGHLKDGTNFPINHD